MLTIKEIRAMKPGEWRTDGGARGAGTLVFHASSSGKVSGYFRHTLPTGKRYDLPLGLFDEAGKTGATLTGLRERAGELSRLYQSGIRDLKAHFEGKECEAREEEEARIRAQEEREAATHAEALARERFTLQRLLEAYAGHLEGQGKVRARDAASAFRNHVYPAGEIASLPAREVTPDHIATLIRRVQEQGKARMAGVLRSYLLAAFNAATKAKYDATLPADLIPFGVTANPVQVIPARSGVTPGTRTLNREELAGYLARVWGDNLTDRFLGLHLMTAGQRVSQLLRVRVADYDPAEGSIRLWDGKGRRVQAREHVLPLGPMGAELVEVLIDRAKVEAAKVASRTGGEVDPNPSLFLSTGGACMVINTPGKRVAEIASDMKGLPFDARDIRRTCETLLAGMGVSRDIRAQLLSHGLSGVQDKHYDRHGYIEEKRNALERWEGLLAEIVQGEERSNVVQMRRRRRA